MIVNQWFFVSLLYLYTEFQFVQYINHRSDCSPTQSDPTRPIIGVKM